MQLDGKRAVLAFVRGQTRWDSLKKLGVVRSENQSEVKVAVPPDFPVVRPTIADVAVGLISQRGAQRQEWASVLLALNVDFANLEDNKRGAAVLEAVWDAARGDVSEDALRAAREILSGPAVQN